jgi:hypothetical protein
MGTCFSNVQISTYQAMQLVQDGHHVKRRRAVSDFVRVVESGECASGQAVLFSIRDVEGVVSGDKMVPVQNFRCFYICSSIVQGFLACLTLNFDLQFLSYSVYIVHNSLLAYQVEHHDLHSRLDSL